MSGACREPGVYNRGMSSDPQTPASGHAPDAASAKDPVCGKKVARSSMWFVHHNGETYYLCSLSCALQFKSNPDGFAAGGAQTA